MNESTAQQAIKPPPIPSIAEHIKPAAISQPAVTSHWLNFHLIVPDLSITQWASRLFKFGLGTLIATVALALPFLIIGWIGIAITNAMR